MSFNLNSTLQKGRTCSQFALYDEFQKNQSFAFPLGYTVRLEYKPNEFRADRDITKDPSLSQFEVLDPFYVFHEYLRDVWSVFHQNFLVKQLPNEFHAEREITKGCSWSLFEAVGPFSERRKIHSLVFPLGYTGAISVSSVFHQSFFV